jgi:hypothetical protein
MKRTIAVAAIVLVALAAAGIAVARGTDDTKNVRAVSATFAATTASRVQTRSCTTPDNKTITVSDGVYTGMSTGDPDLTGATTIRAHSVINTTDNVGLVTGTLRIDVAGRDTEAAIDTVYSSGSVAGLAVGRAHDPAARLVANLSAGFTPAGGFTGGKLGASGGGGAIELSGGSCHAAKPVRENSAARGTVSANAGGSITVAGLTCSVPPELQSKAAGFPVNSRAEIHCKLLSGTNTLTDIRR